MQSGHLGLVQHEGHIAELVGIHLQVVEGDEAGDELAVEGVVGAVDGSHAPVGVVG